MSLKIVRITAGPYESMPLKYDIALIYSNGMTSTAKYATKEQIQDLCQQAGIPSPFDSKPQSQSVPTTTAYTIPPGLSKHVVNTIRPILQQIETDKQAGLKRTVIMAEDQPCDVHPVTRQFIEHTEDILTNAIEALKQMGIKIVETEENIEGVLLHIDLQ